MVQLYDHLGWTTPRATTNARKREHSGVLFLVPASDHAHSPNAPRWPRDCNGTTLIGVAFWKEHERCALFFTYRYPLGGLLRLTFSPLYEDFRILPILPIARAKQFS